MAFSSSSLLKGAVVAACLALPIVPSAAAEPRVLDGQTAKVAGYVEAKGGEATIELSPGVQIRLAPDTQVRVMTTQFLSLPGGMTRVFTVVLRNGRTDVSIRPRVGRRDAVLVTTLDQVAGIATSGESTFVTQPQGLLMANVNGSLLGQRKGRWHPVPRFERRHYTTPDTAPDVSPIAAAPQWSRTRLLQVAPSGTVELRPVAWKHAAQAYEVDVPTTQGTRQRIHTTDRHLPLGIHLPVGTHQVRCRAIDEQGVAGRWSTSLEVRVVGVALPPGALVESDGGIGLGPGQVIQFERADGLVMWHHATHRTVPSTTPVGLHDGRRTLLALRTPGTLDFTLVKLVPRRARAVAYVGPKDAFWPDDIVELRYRLDDGAGNAAPEGIQPQAEVTLDARPLEVDWKQQGAWMTARVRPRHDCGRCVVRLEVRDQHGVPLGRDFVEIIEVQPRELVATKRSVAPRQTR